MVREFYEECGIITRKHDWLWTESIEFTDGLVLDVLGTVLPQNVAEPEKTTDEQPYVYPVREVLSWTPHPVLNIQDKITYAIERLNKAWRDWNYPAPRISRAEYQI
jgi:hypothetical protein